MSITTAYNTLQARVAALLPNHQRLGNPYEIEENPAPFLKQGYGIGLGPANNTERQISCQGSAQRDLLVTITRKFYARDTDRATKATVELELLEDLQLIMDDAEKNFQAPTSTAIYRYATDNGIESVYADEDHYLMVQAVVSAEILKTL